MRVYETKLFSKIIFLHPFFNTFSSTKLKWLLSYWTKYVETILKSILVHDSKKFFIYLVTHIFSWSNDPIIFLKIDAMVFCKIGRLHFF